jgi:hypothetical protein
MKSGRATALAVFAVLGVFTLGPSSGCSSSSNGAADGDAGDDSGGSSGSSGGFNQTDDSGVPITLNQVNCPGGGTTSLHGTVLDPAGKLPLYNVAVYVPKTAPGPLPEGVSCGDCTTWYTNPLVSAVTDAGGNFTITNMPVGTNIPLVVQVGKWRKIYSLSNVTQCVTNDAASLAGGPLRLPKNRSEGSIPNIAISTGALDSLECLIRRMGIDASEYTGNPMTGPDLPRIHIFTGGAPNSGGVQTQGAVTQNPTSQQSGMALWNSDTSLMAYDVVLLSCEGRETAYIDDTHRKFLLDYANGGGRVFASHYHYSWFNTGPFAAVTPALATWSPEGTPGKLTTVGPNGDQAPPVPADIVTTLPNGKPFPEGVGLHQWLTNNGALTNDKLPIWYARHNADLSAANTGSQAWVNLDPSTSAPNAAEYFSFDTPIGSGGEACGRVVYSDLHVSGGINASNNPAAPPDYPGLPITPDGCDPHALTPQEKALEFMIFDLSSCLTPIGEPITVRQPQ